jgi:hypothetical protein
MIYDFGPGIIAFLSFCHPLFAMDSSIRLPIFLAGLLIVGLMFEFGYIVPLLAVGALQVMVKRMPPKTNTALTACIMEKTLG